MTNKSLIFAGIFAAILGNNAFATGENTVTSKSYVDAQDALKQDKITAKTSGNVVTYNGTDANGQAQFDERGIFDGEVDYTDRDADDLITAGAVQGQINGINNDISNINTNISNISNTANNNITNVINGLTSQSLPTITVQRPLTCANAPDCTLWTLTDSAVAHKITECGTDNDCPSCETGYIKKCVGATEGKGGPTGGSCQCVYGACNTATDCPACGTGTKAACENNICKCNACKVDGMSATNSAECCSGIIGSKTNQCCGTPGGLQCPQK